MVASKQWTLGGVVLCVFSLFLFSGCTAVHQAHANLQMDHSHAESATTPSADPDLVQDWAKQRLAKSPRLQRERVYLECADQSALC